jgi:hypothetical protein
LLHLGDSRVIHCRLDAGGGRRSVRMPRRSGLHKDSPNNAMRQRVPAGMQSNPERLRVVLRRLGAQVRVSTQPSGSALVVMTIGMVAPSFGNRRIGPRADGRSALASSVGHLSRQRRTGHRNGHPTTREGRHGALLGMRARSPPDARPGQVRPSLSDRLFTRVWVGTSWVRLPDGTLGRPECVAATNCNQDVFHDQDRRGHPGPRGGG